MRDFNVPLDPLMDKIDELESGGRTVVMVAADGALRGLIAVSDTIKPGSYLAVRELGRMGVDTVMVTGDNRKPLKPLQGK